MEAETILAYGDPSPGVTIDRGGYDPGKEQRDFGLMTMTPTTIKGVDTHEGGNKESLCRHFSFEIL